MTLLYFSISGPEWLLLAFGLALIIAIGHFGRNTILGYYGTVLVCIICTPFVGFALAWILRSRMVTIQLKPMNNTH